jgi:hypothetical protein
MTMNEPTLDDLLEDDIMKVVVRSAGTDITELRARLAETARRLSAIRPIRRNYCAIICC